MNSSVKIDHNWFASWFNTPYYHILYKDRNDKEAQVFMKHLTQYLSIPKGSSILDLACGKGRHSIFLNQLGYNVTGVDLSANSIAEAKKHENDGLRFFTHDMRKNYPAEFDAVFNLFTSFGYFDNEADDLEAITSIKNSLNDQGFGVIDFLNTNYVISNLVEKETKVVDAINFTITRTVQDQFILKNIQFTDQGKQFSFTEKVKALTLADFEKYFEQAGLTLLDIFGDYKLNKFDAGTSQRLILIFK